MQLRLLGFVRPNPMALRQRAAYYKELRQRRKNAGLHLCQFFLPEPVWLELQSLASIEGRTIGEVVASMVEIYRTWTPSPTSASPDDVCQ